MKQKPTQKAYPGHKLKVVPAKGFRPMKLKTIRALLEDLPAELRRFAIINADAEHADKEWRNKIPQVQQGSYALAAAFDWGKSPEGHDYWLNVHSLLIKREKDSLCISPN
jgi:hypothetical protein